MKLSAYFIIIIYLASVLMGCTNVDDKPIEAAPSPIDQQSNKESELKKKYVKKLSQIYGYWDIISFDDYIPIRESLIERNYAYVHFKKGHVGFRLECNNAGMPANLPPSGALKKASQDAHIVSDAMSCGDEKNAREGLFFKFFSSQPKIEIFSPTELHLTTDDHVLVVRKRETTPESFNGLWQLRSVDGVNVWTSETPRLDFLEFNSSPENSSVSVFNGCNNGGARTKFMGPRIRFSNYISQLEGCGGSLKALSRQYRALLFADGTYEIDGEHLLIDSQNTTYEFIKLKVKPQIRPYKILSNPFTRKAEGGDEHFFLGEWGKWQFVDKPDPTLSELGPDSVQQQKPFIKFNPQHEMWGHDGEIFFHRRYEFNDDTITFSPDPKRCEEDCFDRSAKIGVEKRFAQQRFMGRYSFEIDGKTITLSNENETVMLDPYIKLLPLPRLPKDQPLCEIRDMHPNETFPNYPKATLPEYGYSGYGE